MKLLALSIQGPNGTPIQIQAPGGIPTGGNASFNVILQSFITLFFVLGLLMSLVYLIWGGFNWIMSQGDKTKVQAARNRVIYAIIGLIVMFLAYVIINLIGSIFGVKLY